MPMIFSTLGSPPNAPRTLVPTFPLAPVMTTRMVASYPEPAGRTAARYTLHPSALSAR